MSTSSLLSSCLEGKEATAPRMLPGTVIGVVAPGPASVV